MWGSSMNNGRLAAAPVARYVGAAVAFGRLGLGDALGAATLTVAHGQIAVLQSEVPLSLGKISISISIRIRITAWLHVSSTSRKCSAIRRLCPDRACSALRAGVCPSSVAGSRRTELRTSEMFW